MKLAENNAVAKVESLRTNIAAIISNVVNGRGNDIDNIIELLALNDSVAKTVTANVEAFAVNEIEGRKNELVNDLKLEVLNDGKFLHNVFLQLTGLTFTDIQDGDNNFAENKLDLEFGKSARWGRDEDESYDEATEADAIVSAIVDAILVNEIENGNDNTMKNILDIAIFNKMKLDGIKAEVEFILVNQVRPSACYLVGRSHPLSPTLACVCTSWLTVPAECLPVGSMLKRKAGQGMAGVRSDRVGRVSLAGCLQCHYYAARGCQRRRSGEHCQHCSWTVQWRRPVYRKGLRPGRVCNCPERHRWRWPHHH